MISFKIKSLIFEVGTYIICILYFYKQTLKNYSEINDKVKSNTKTIGFEYKYIK